MLNSATLVRKWGAKALWISLVIVSMMATYMSVGVWRGKRALRAAAPKVSTAASARVRINPFASSNGTNLIAFVVTASNCGWSGQPAVIQAIRATRKKLRATYGTSYAQVNVVGVALDRDVDTGLRFLSEIGDGKPSGAFDQVIVGGSWLNEQVVRLVWREAMVHAESPQIIVVERPINTTAYLSTATIALKADKLVANPVGSRAILNWIREGTPLDNAATGLARGDSAR